MYYIFKLLAIYIALYSSKGFRKKGYYKDFILFKYKFGYNKALFIIYAPRSLNLKYTGGLSYYL